MTAPSERRSSATAPGFVPETNFGIWFLNSRIWLDHVLKVALRDLCRMMPDGTAHWPVVLDVGCGQGQSLPLLMAAFGPECLIGLEFDAALLASARRRAATLAPAAALLQGNCACLPLRDVSVDLIFCHQTFHHLVQQDLAPSEFHRVLRPGGLLLFAESTRAYIHSWIIRLLFSHPMQVQRSAEEYLAMLRRAGFAVAPDAISCPFLWWSRPDLGVTERWLRIRPPPPGRREETLLNVVAVKRQAD